MIEIVSRMLVHRVLAPRIQYAERVIGYRPFFRWLPERFIDACVSWNITDTFRSAALPIEAAANYWSMGRIVNGVSSRFDPVSDEYQSWIGAYAVRLAKRQVWSARECFRMAVADQNSWLRMYGDERPATRMYGDCRQLDRIRIGHYDAKVYEVSCVTHTDVGPGDSTKMLRLKAELVAALFNYANPRLRLSGDMFVPQVGASERLRIRLRGLWMVVDVADDIKVVLYGNGTESTTDASRTGTFHKIRPDLLRALRSCEIVRLPKSNDGAALL